MLSSLRGSVRVSALRLAPLSTLRSTQQAVGQKVQQAVDTIHRTVLDVMARAMPERDRHWLAEK